MGSRASQVHSAAPQTIYSKSQEHDVEELRLAAVLRSSSSAAMSAD